jgi:cell division protein FtsB
MQVRISELDEAIVEAAIADDFDRKNKLEKESRDLRIQREKTIMKIKNLEVPQQKAVNDGYVERIESLEADVRGLRSQISMVRGDINDLKDMVESIMRSLQMDDEDEIQ